MAPLSSCLALAAKTNFAFIDRRTPIRAICHKYFT